MSAEHAMTGDDREAIRAALGRLGDRSLPAPDFDELHLRAVGDRPPGPRASWLPRLLPVIATVAVVAGLGAAFLLIDPTANPTGDDVATDVAPSSIVETDTEPEIGGPASIADEPDPASAAPEALQDAVRVLGVERLMVRDPSGEILVATTDGVTRIDGPDGFVWSDGMFIYGSGAGTGEVAMLLDGTVVCEVDGEIDHVTERTDGTYVAAVEGSEAVGTGRGSDEPYDIPLFAVDCSTHELIPIEPVNRVNLGDGETEHTYRVASRTFVASADAEGNTTALTDESGRDLIDGDYLGLTVIRSDAALVAYGDQRQSVSPHVTPTVVVRDLGTGERLWTETIDGVMTRLWFAGGDRLAVGASEWPTDGGVDPARLIAFEATTGDRLAEVEAPPGVFFVG